MAGTRTEKIGSILTRVNALLRSGAMKEADKPLWYDVMVAFPPRVDPTFERLVDNRKTIDIVYPEDNIRAKFYSVFGNPKPINMLDASSVSVSQKFITKYQELALAEESSANTSNEEQEERLFDLVVKKLKEEDGIKLKSLEDIRIEKKEAKAKAMNSRKAAELEQMEARILASEIFGGVTEYKEVKAEDLESLEEEMDSFSEGDEFNDKDNRPKS